VELGRVRYARNGDVRIAYRVIGSGDTTMVWTPGWISNLDLLGNPLNPFAALLQQLVDDTRIVTFDKRGTGLSDPVTRIPPLDERMDDLHAVMDAAGLDSPVSLFGISEGGPMSILFAATFPERVRSLVLYGTAPRFTEQLPDWPWGHSPAKHQAYADDIDAHWGEGALADLLFGSAMADMPGFRDLLGDVQRLCASPMMARMLWRALMDIDVRAVLDLVRTPTLVLTRPGDEVAPIDGARAMAAAIPGAKLHELSPGPHALMDAELAAAIRDFVCDRSASATSERVLSTVLFTDIVGSTEQLSATGDANWRHQLDAHDKVVDWLLGKYGGNRAKHTGDGIFALFDGPTKAARCALDLVPALATRGIRIRAGVHTGECERRGQEWSGTAVHVGARIGAMAGPDEVLASRTVRDLSAGSGLRFESLGAHRLKGLSEATEIFQVATPAAT
jgi:pimeloyl-ACP methyl ester carboxylesterase